MGPKKLTEAERRMRPDFVAGVPRGRPMTRGQAGGLSSNPRFYDKDSYERGYQENCQSCVVSYVMRLRGYDVEAERWDSSNKMQIQLAKNSTLAWIDPRSKRHPALTIVPARDAISGIKWMRSTLVENGIYTFEFRWIQDGSRHIVILTRNKKSLLIYDPQSGKMIINDKQMNLMKSIIWNPKYEPKILRVDKLEPNLNIINAVLKPKVK